MFPLLKMPFSPIHSFVFKIFTQYVVVVEVVAAAAIVVYVRFCQFQIVIHVSKMVRVHVCACNVLLCALSKWVLCKMLSYIIVIVESVFVYGRPNSNNLSLPIVVAVVVLAYQNKTKNFCRNQNTKNNKTI